MDRNYLNLRKRKDATDVCRGGFYGRLIGSDITDNYQLPDIGVNLDRQTVPAIDKFYTLSHGWYGDGQMGIERKAIAQRSYPLATILGNIFIVRREQAIGY